MYFSAPLSLELSYTNGSPFLNHVEPSHLEIENYF